MSQEKHSTGLVIVAVQSLFLSTIQVLHVGPIITASDTEVVHSCCVMAMLCGISFLLFFYLHLQKMDM